MSSTAPKDSLQTHYDAQVTALQGGRFKDPFSFLGTHAYKNGYEIRVYLPAAKNVNIIINDIIINMIIYRIDTDCLSQQHILV